MCVCVFVHKRERERERSTQVVYSFKSLHPHFMQSLEKEDKRRKRKEKKMRKKIDRTGYLEDVAKAIIQSYECYSFKKRSLMSKGDRPNDKINKKSEYFSGTAAWNGASITIKMVLTYRKSR